MLDEQERPDLSHVDAAIRDYIEALERELLYWKGQSAAAARPSTVSGPETAVFPDPPEPSEPPTPINVISVSTGGQAKRTPRHFYSRQHRGGMGVFDLESSDEDPPALLALADISDHLLCFTNQGRGFRLPVRALPETAVRGRGQPLTDKLPLRPHERVIAMLPAEPAGGQNVALASQRGWVRLVHKSRLSSSLIPGLSFFDTSQGGPIMAACWTVGTTDLLLMTRLGSGIRFAESQVHKQGSLGIRLDAGDEVVSITAVSEDSSVFLISDDGKGTIRLMSGFRANKAPGSGGKQVIKTDRLIGGVTVSTTDDLFLISASGKIIRFLADEVPAKEGVVHGVNCMTLRNDTVTAVTR